MPGTVLGTRMHNEQTFGYKTGKACRAHVLLGGMGDEATEVGRGQVVMSGRAQTVLQQDKGKALKGFKQEVTGPFFKAFLPLTSDYSF